MKLYEMAGPPSPRRIRIFLAEKGVELETISVNIREGEHLKPAFKAINSRCTIPALEMDNGVVLTESDAIMRYLEEKFPEPALFGSSAEERAVVNDWLHIIDVDGFMAVAEMLRNSNQRFANRALTGPRDIAQIPALGERGAARIGYFHEELDKQLADREFVAGDSFTVADINALVVVDFAQAVNYPIPDRCKNVRRWHAEISARPSIAV